MANETFRLDSHTASANVYARVFDHLGQVLDFDDDTFGALSGLTTPYKAATERGDLDGTSLSAYDVALNLSTLNDRPEPRRFSLGWYDDATPADADVRISNLLDFTVQSGRLGSRAAMIQFTGNVKSTAGDTLQLAVSVEEEDAGLVNLHAIGGTAFTATNATNTINCTAHGLSDDDAILLSGGDLPNGLTAFLIVYIVNSTANTFQVSLTLGGAAITFSDDGSGTMLWHRPTCTVTFREHGSGADLFTSTVGPESLANDGSGNVIAPVFEWEQSSPSFTDDRSYDVEVVVTYDGGNVFTATNASNQLDDTAHGLADEDVVVLTGADLPNGWSAYTPYNVRDATADAAKLSTAPKGAVVAISDDGTGTHKWFRPLIAHLRDVVIG